MVYTASLCFGLVIGSFLNVVILRLPEERSLVRPGSHCPACKTPIRVWDNLPILSWLLLRGKCRACSHPISARYPIVEGLTALLFIATAAKFGFGAHLFLREWPLVALLVAITFIDVDHRIIPDELSLPGIGLGLITALLTSLGWIEGGTGIGSSLIGAATGYGLFWLFATAYERFSGRVGLGGGDVKLLAMIGAFTGFSGVFCTVFVSSVFGSIVGLAYGYFTRAESLRLVALPYGPFLVLGALYYILLGDLLWLPSMIPT